jgi:ADP-ribose pyrophosphatase YjhB (NUDIX family)
VAAVIARASTDTNDVEVVLGSGEDEVALGLPKGFVRPNEAPAKALARVLKTETGWDPEGQELELVFDGWAYDRRQTDNAWVESQAFLIQNATKDLPATFAPGAEFEEVRWRPLDADTVNRLPPDQAELIRQAVKRLMETGRMNSAAGTELLAATG